MVGYIVYTNTRSRDICDMYYNTYGRNQEKVTLFTFNGINNWKLEKTVMIEKPTLIITNHNYHYNRAICDK